MKRFLVKLRCVVIGHNVHVTEGLIWPGGYCVDCGKYIRMGID